MGGDELIFIIIDAVDTATMLTTMARKGGKPGFSSTMSQIEREATSIKP